MEFFNSIKRVDKQIFESGIFGFSGFVRNGEKVFFSLSNQLTDGGILIVGLFGNLGASSDETSANRSLFDKLSVSLGVRSGRDKIWKFGKVWDAANIFEGFFGLQDGL